MGVLDKWQQEYLQTITKMSNKEVFDEYTELAGGDDYDGCFTIQGGWKWEMLQIELTNRLKKIGFL